MRTTGFKSWPAVCRIFRSPWLQGHSPPPLANWFTDIANAAVGAGAAVWMSRRRVGLFLVCRPLQGGRMLGVLP